MLLVCLVIAANDAKSVSKIQFADFSWKITAV